MGLLLLAAGFIIVGLHWHLYHKLVYIEDTSPDQEFVESVDYDKLVGLSVLAGACFGGAITLLWIGA